jgi:hypothetical protein
LAGFKKIEKNYNLEMKKKERRWPIMEQGGVQGKAREKEETSLARGSARKSKGEEKWRL